MVRLGFESHGNVQAAWLASGAVIFGVIAGFNKAISEFMNFNQELLNAAAVVQATAERL